jgi:DNA-binding NtrC family response regulator
MRNMTKIFIVEDELMYAKRIKHFLSLNPDYEIYVFGHLHDALQFMDDTVDCVVLDHYLPDGEGLNYISKFMAFSPNLPVLVISSQKDTKVAEKFIEKGAFEYMVKDEFLELRLKMAFSKVNRQLTFNREYKRLQSLKMNYGTHELVGQSIEMDRIRLLVTKAQESRIHVSIQGETGTGKEVVARSIHAGESWNRKPFVAINMSAIPMELAESALFGHEVGAFSGAVNTKKGVFEEAADGILFLDEIGDAPLELQVKLLRAIQEKVFRRVGGTKDIPFNARIITATHCDLYEMVQNGEFREDLYYRLMGFPIKLYPLRDHKGDIPALVDRFMSEQQLADGVRTKIVSKEAQEKLMQHQWPGNIRELKAVIQLAIILSDDDIINPDDLRIESTLSREVAMETHRVIGDKSLKDYTREIIEEHMQAFDDDLDKVSNVLQIGKSTLYRMLKNNEIKRTSK